MKKLFIVLAVASIGFVACNNESATETAKDSTANVIDSTAKTATDSISNMADSANKKIDSVASAVKDSLKK